MTILIDQAIKALYGGSPITVNGCKLKPIRGMSAGDFQDTLHEYTRFKLEKAGKEGKASLPEYYGYINLGAGKYLLTQNRIPVSDEEGSKIIIDMKDVPKETISKNVEREKRLQALFQQFEVPYP